MRAALVAMLILLLPAALSAGPMMGIYFTYNPGQMTYSPTAYEEFYGYVFLTNSPCWTNGVEFKIARPAGIIIDEWTCEFPDLTIGTLEGGIAMAFPPGYPPYEGYNWILTMKLLATKWCWNEGGTLQDTPMSIVANPDSGYLRGSCGPKFPGDPDLYDIAGLTSIFCPYMIGTEEQSWGAIKSLF